MTMQLFALFLTLFTLPALGSGAAAAGGSVADVKSDADAKTCAAASTEIAVDYSVIPSNVMEWLKAVCKPQKMGERSKFRKVSEVVMRWGEREIGQAWHPVFLHYILKNMHSKSEVNQVFFHFAQPTELSKPYERYIETHYIALLQALCTPHRETPPDENDLEDGFRQFVFRLFLTWGIKLGYSAERLSDALNKCIPIIDATHSNDSIKQRLKELVRNYQQRLWGRMRESLLESGAPRLALPYVYEFIAPREEHNVVWPIPHDVVFTIPELSNADTVQADTAAQKIIDWLQSNPRTNKNARLMPTSWPKSVGSEISLPWYLTSCMYRNNVYLHFYDRTLNPVQRHRDGPTAAVRRVVTHLLHMKPNIEHGMISTAVHELMTHFPDQHSLEYAYQMIDLWAETEALPNIQASISGRIRGKQTDFQRNILDYIAYLQERPEIIAALDEHLPPEIITVALTHRHQKAKPYKRASLSK